MRNLARKNPVAHEILYYLVENMGRTHKRYRMQLQDPLRGYWGESANGRQSNQNAQRGQLDRHREDWECVRLLRQ